jgi:hypothetical protein
METLVLLLAISSCVHAAAADYQAASNTLAMHRISSLTQDYIAASHPGSPSTYSLANTTTPARYTLYADRAAATKPPTFMGLTAREITLNPAICTRKDAGLNPGKICIISGVKYYLKSAPSIAADTRDDSFDRTAHLLLLAKYNLTLLQKKLGIHVPEIDFFYEKGGHYTDKDGKTIVSEFYCGSKFIADFTSIGCFYETINMQEISKKVKRSLKKDRSLASDIPTLIDIHIRNELVKKIGEDGIAKLAVAGSFIQDLINNNGNWGYDANGLVIIDADTSAHNVDGFFETAKALPGELLKNKIALSISDVEKMVSLYDAMLESPPPALHTDVNILKDDYDLLIRAYKNACQEVIAHLRQQSPVIPEKMPNKIVNLEMEKQLTIAYEDYKLRQDGPLSTSLR